MKLHVTPTQHYQTVTGYDQDWIEINATRFEHSLIVFPEIAPVAWPVSAFETLTAADLEVVGTYEPDLLILGTGQRQRFAHPKLLSGLLTRGIGVECMDNQAACRTYNILMAEGRKVALALIMQRTEPQT